MASAAVNFLLNNILQLLKDKAELISKVKDEVENLKMDLRMFKAFLKDCAAGRGRSCTDSDTFNELIKQIQEVTHKAEDAFESYVFTAAHHLQHDNSVRRFLSSIIHFPKLATITGDITNLRKDIKKIYEYRLIALDAISMRDGNCSSRWPMEKQAPVVEDNNVVGFDGHAQKIIEKLKGGSGELEVVSIIGMPGLGKTTLANKIYKDRDVEFDFMLRSWVYVSQTYTRKEVFLEVLRHVSGQLTDYMYKMSADELIKEIRGKLENHKYLIVMDDVWSNVAWNELQAAFPRNNKGSRILITSRIRDVAVQAYEPGIYELPFLSDDECWLLLKLKVFRSKTCPHEDLKSIGQFIARKCDGLPLAVVIIAGILLRNFNNKDWWTRIAEKVTDYVARDEEQCKKVVRWSYDNLPDHLKVCFLYIGIFPEDCGIPVWKLTFLWIAEGFIEQKEGETLEETAEEYLSELIDKNLVLAGDKTIDGRIKKCRIHDMMHDLCKKLAAEQNLFNVVKDTRKYINSLSSNDDALHMYRRLCVHSSTILDFVKSKHSAARTRSILSMGLEDMKLPLEHHSFIPKSFQLLRVLDVSSIIFERLPKDLTCLVLLRYIAMSISFKVIPSDISKLWNLQILIIKVTSPSSTLDIKADLWQMLQLRNLHTNVSTNLVVPPPKTKKGNESHPSLIQTLTSVSPQCCTEEVLAKITNVKKLGIRGKLQAFLDANGGKSSFGTFANLVCLETLKLHDHVASSFVSGGKNSGFPRHCLFPPNLKRLTLSNTMLNWEHMATLGMLPNLVVLKLKEKAFLGEYWEPKLGGFRCLKVFYLGRTDLKDWDQGSSDHFPVLAKLILKHCDSLEAIPSGLANLLSLQLINVYCTNRSVAASARQIQQQKQTNNNASTALQVFIYPSVHDPHSKSSVDSSHR